MCELVPKIWITALRKVQNPNRAGLDIVSHNANFNTLKASLVKEIKASGLTTTNNGGI